ncbi:MAG TPA: hypothetical protein VNO52_05300, partial [Methylomirabilota bacterium]|nr:hypothetical protein [Methylomirabilota bacterium]
RPTTCQQAFYRIANQPVPQPGEVCDDRLDNDGDDLVDFQDPDCQPDCKVRVVITSIKVITATDANDKDFYRSDYIFVNVNGREQRDGFFSTLEEIAEGMAYTPEEPIEIFNQTVGKKGDELTIIVRLGMQEIDAMRDEADLGEGRLGPVKDGDKLPRCETRVIERTIKVKLQPSPDPTDHDPPEVGEAEIRIRIEIDP